MTNSANLAEVLTQAQRKGLHKHQHLAGWPASACQVYPQPFVELITESIKKEIRDAQWRKGMGTKFDISAPVEKLMSIMATLEELGRKSEARRQECQPRCPWDFSDLMEH